MLEVHGDHVGLPCQGQYTACRAKDSTLPAMPRTVHCQPCQGQYTACRAKDSTCRRSGLETMISMPSADHAHSVPALIISQVHETNSAAP